MLIVESWGVLLSNAYDADGLSGLQVELVGQATNGHVEISSYGSFVYTPNLNCWGPDSFTYRVFDGYEYSNLATASLTIWSVNDPPVASDVTFSLPEDEQCFTADVLVSDLGIDGDTLNVVLTSCSVPGQLWMLSGGYFQYIPPQSSAPKRIRNGLAASVSSAASAVYVGTVEGLFPLVVNCNSPQDCRIIHSR